MITPRANQTQQILSGILVPVAAFVAWFGLGAFLLSKHATPLLDLL
ncbi:MAG: hypothetical protein QF689_04915 [Candidatus Latescibacteria bacterium]|jgi:hypothetical protein|nr:hypothetical protein [Candidatus Latescibacterota bacterium]MDP7447911.1 hypothetical protein [Candidatus Latescibacterota bacterium]HJP31457.1 hypothetical protein [Candidatus Latescibacterota bacterium]|tara:strand:+ start:711 stop:848 length:138 start_codon:yes stop_codon:yes gene_type:complete